MAVLVTGGTGVIGSHVARQLVEEGADVVLTSASGDSSLVSDLAGELVVHACDIRDTAALGGLMTRHRVDIVVHLAAVLPGACDANPAEAVAVNVGATASLYAAAAEAGVERLVYSSSKSAYGPDLPPEHGPPRCLPIPEELPARPAGMYDVTKYAGELVLAACARGGGPEVTSLRFATILGPGKRRRHGSHAVLSVLVEEADAGRPVRIERGGDQVDDVIWVGDAAAGVLAAARAPGRLEPLYNIATGIGVSLSDFADVVRAINPGADVEVGPGLHYMGEAATYGVLDVTRAREGLSFEATTGHAEGVRRYSELAELLASAA